jgi:hypothetical protein
MIPNKSLNFSWIGLETEKVLRKLGYNISDEIITAIVNNKPGYVEYLLFELRQKVVVLLSHK